MLGKHFAFLSAAQYKGGYHLHIYDSCIFQSAVMPSRGYKLHMWLGRACTPRRWGHHISYIMEDTQRSLFTMGWRWQGLLARLSLLIVFFRNCCAYYSNYIRASMYGTIPFTMQYIKLMNSENVTHSWSRRF